MGSYTDVDQLAINTIRVLAVSTCCLLSITIQFACQGYAIAGGRGIQLLDISSL